MKTINLFLALGIFAFFFSCSKDDKAKSSDAKLLKVTCSFAEGTVDTSAHTVTIKAPESTDITQIIPQFEISANASIYPPSGVATDFTDPVTYTITSEDKTSTYVFTVTVLKPVVKFTVNDCSNWTPVSYSVIAPDATIKVYTKTEDVGTDKLYETLTTDANGQATLWGPRTTNYYFTAEKDSKSNIVNGYLLLGTYNNQAEADMSADPNATVGGLRFADINGDMKLDASDKISYQTIWSDNDLQGTGIFEKSVYIAQ